MSGLLRCYNTRPPTPESPIEPWKVDVSLWRLGDAPRELYFDPHTLRRRLTAETAAPSCG
jgi:hypothetical protein